MTTDVLAEHQGGHCLQAERSGEGLLARAIGTVRRESRPATRVATALDVFGAALGADGAGLIGAAGGTALPVRDEAARRLATALLAQSTDGACRAGVTGDGHSVLAVAVAEPHHAAFGVVFWRRPEGKPWSLADCAMAAAVGEFIGLLLDHEAELRRAAESHGTDPQTGFLTTATFRDEVERRLARLDREAQPGTLVLFEIDDLDAFLRAHGRAVCDEMLDTLATLLRVTFRPSDPLGRLTKNRFAVWMDGADALTAAERAETIRNSAPRMVIAVSEDRLQTISLTFGIATRLPADGDEGIPALLARAEGGLERFRHLV